MQKTHVPLKNNRIIVGLIKLSFIFFLVAVIVILYHMKYGVSPYKMVFVER